MTSSSSHAVASPKRGSAERTGLANWFPYYAGFSSAFVVDMLKHLGVPRSGVVVDPMNGSGTTTVVGQQEGMASIGTDLNPVMVALARAKDKALLAQIENLPELVDATEEMARSSAAEFDLAPDAEEWLATETFQTFKRLEVAADHAEVDTLERDPRLTALLLPDSMAAVSLRDLLKASLLVTLRECSHAQASKNPTWIKPGDRVNVPAETIFSRFRDTSRRLGEDLEREFGSGAHVSQTAVGAGDARRLPLAAEVADAVITSPPYLTRIDYAVTTAPELVFLGYQSADSLKGLRSEIMGSTCISGGEYEIQESWGSTCRAFLERVENHPSKASGSYYYKTHVQYFRDAEPIVREALRILKPGATAVFVVQDSWYKDVHAPLGDIYVEMGEFLGAKGKILRSETVLQHMGLVNTRARRYAKGKIHEHVVMLTK